jgi:DNA-binding MarR family transcriptional regulator
MTSSEHGANVLGALALVLHDRMSAAVSEAAGQPENGAAALSMLSNFLAQPRVGLLHQALGLTPSGAVRMIDKLEADGHVRRGPGGDGRSTSVSLTAGGRRAARRVTDARLSVLDEALSVLSDDERAVLDELAGRMLVGLMREPGATRWMCRLCNSQACGHVSGGCPVANEARERYGYRPKGTSTAAG